MNNRILAAEYVRPSVTATFDTIAWFAARLGTRQTKRGFRRRYSGNEYQTPRQNRITICCSRVKHKWPLSRAVLSISGMDVRLR